MKRFFIVLLILFFLACAFSGLISGQSKVEYLSKSPHFSAHKTEFDKQNAQSISNEQVEMAQKWLSLPKAIKQMHLSASMVPAEEANDLSKYNLLTPMYLMQKDAGLFSGTKGYGQWHDLPFGKVRLVSCRSGLDEYAKPLLTALQAQIKPDWLLQKPSISVITPVQKLAIPYPLTYPLPAGKTKTNSYSGETFFPIIIDPISVQDTITLLVQMDWQAEPLSTKETQTGRIELVLPLISEQSYETGICTHLQEQLSLAPAPLDKKNQVSALLNTEGLIQLHFKFKKNITFLSVQIDKAWTFTEEQKNIQGNSASLIIRPSEAVKQGQTIPLKIITSFGRFSKDVIVQQAPFISLKEPFSWGKIISGGILLFFATPLLGWLILQSPRTKKQMLKQTKETMLCIGVCSIILTLLWQFKIWIPTNVIQIWPFSAWIFFFVFLFLIIWPLKSLSAVLAVTFILPKPYLDNIVEIANDYAYLPCVCGLVWTILTIWPFWWIIRYQNGWFSFYKKIKKHMLLVRSSIALPFLIMAIWITIAGGVNTALNTSLPPYNAQDIQTLLKNNKKVIVLVEPPICFLCAWNKGINLNSGYANTYIQSGKLIPMRLSTNTHISQKLRSQFGQRTLPMTILFTPNSPEGQLIQDGLNSRFFKEIMGK